MDMISRRLTKQRESGFEQSFDFTTYPIIFDSTKWPKDPKVRAVMTMLQTSFLTGFKKLPKSPSQMPELMVGTEKIASPLCGMAKMAGYRGKGNEQHRIVQNYFLQNHPDCIAIEVPLWVDDVEGCADFLLMSLDPFHLVIPDLKPNAKGERNIVSEYKLPAVGGFMKTAAAK